MWLLHVSSCMLRVSCSGHVYVCLCECVHTHEMHTHAHICAHNIYIYLLQHPALDCNFTQAVQITVTMGLTLPRLYSTPLWIPSRIFPLKIHIQAHIRACVYVYICILPCACLSWLLLSHFSLLPLIFSFHRERQEGS